ncbi:MAG TPA: YCF48-related protein [Rhodothermales bacterium]|nr:YCF48-related protein [Rhodothermales bacterium]
MKSPRSSLFINLIIAGILLVVCAACDSTTPIDEPPPGEDPLVECPQQSLSTWEFVGLQADNIDRIKALAVHPSKPNVLYAGSSFNFSAGLEGKLFKSIDCGASWDTLRTGGSYLDIQFDPHDPATIYAVPYGILKSTDHGHTWTDISEGIGLDPERRVTSLVIDPAHPEVLYAGTSGFHGGSLYKSTDGGASWTVLDPENRRLSNGVISLAIDPSDTEVLYASTNFFGDLYKSTDGGQTWSILLQETNESIDLLVDPEASSVIYAAFGDRGVMKSVDTGSSWHAFNEGLPVEKKIRQIIKNPQTDALLLVNASPNGQGIYIREAGSPLWMRIGIDEHDHGYYYSDLMLADEGQRLYFGSDGLYRMRLE